MEATVEELVARLRVKRLGEDRYAGETCDVGSPHVFGGQYLGQAVMAAGYTCHGRPVHSLHATFLQPGDKSKPVEYSVRRQHEGASFSRCHVTAAQGDRALFEAQLSFHAPEQGPEHRRSMPGVAAPDGLRGEREARADVQARLPEALRERLPDLWPIDVRPLRSIDALAPERSEPQHGWWLRSSAPLPDDPLLHCALLAYASDFAFLQAALLPHGINFLQPTLRIASLDHAMWFLADFRIDDWLLFDTRSPSFGGARAFVNGDVFTVDGRLVACVAQEGLARVRA